MGMRISRLLLFLMVGCHIQTSIRAQIPMNGLNLWLKAGPSVKTKGSEVLSWADESGNHHDAFTKSERKPFLIPNVINGFPVVRFNGRDNNMQTAPFASFQNKRGTLLIVFRLNGPGYASGAAVGSLLSTYLGNGITWQLCVNEYVYIFYDGVGSEGMPLASVSQNQWEIAGLIRSADSSMTIYRRGEPKLSFPITNNQPDSNAVKIGSNGRLEVLNGDIAEIIMYNRNLTAAEFFSVNEYLAKKYKISQPQPAFTDTAGFYFLIALVLLIISVAVTKFMVQRNLNIKLNELKKQAQLDQERLRISREMHDDIGAGLTQIILMSESARNKLRGSDDKELDGIADTSRKLVSNMSEIVWSLHPENKSLERLFAYLREQIHKLLEYSSIEYNICFPDQVPAIPLTNEQRRNLILVVKEITHNAVKYSKAKNLIVSARLQENWLHFELADDGIGFDLGKKSTGNGLRNIQERMKDLGGHLQVQSENGNGTKFVFSIPVE